VMEEWPGMCALARLFRLLRNPSVCGFGFVDQEAYGCAFGDSGRQTASGMRTGPAGRERSRRENRWLALRPVACEPEPGSGQALSNAYLTSLDFRHCRGSIA